MRVATDSQAAGKMPKTRVQWRCLKFSTATSGISCNSVIRRNRFRLRQGNDCQGNAFIPDNSPDEHSSEELRSATVSAGPVAALGDARLPASRLARTLAPLRTQAADMCWRPAQRAAPTVSLSSREIRP
jgi:hypothetical protein